MIEWITDFIKKVENNPQNYNKHVKNNVRQIKELLNRKTICYKKSDPIAFEKFCRLHKHREGKWSGQPIVLDEIERYISACLLGIKWFNKKENKWLRYFTEMDFFISRKYGKDHFVAPLAEWFAGLDNEPKGWVQILAENTKQSKRTYDIIAESISQEPLSEIFKVVDKSKDSEHIQCSLNDGRIEYMSGRRKGKDGANAYGLLNEIHEITNQNQYNATKTGQGARLQPMMLVVSSAGVTPESLYETLYDRNSKMLQKQKLGKNDKIFALMFGIDEDDDPADEACWIKANPMMPEGRPSIEYLREQYASMKDDPEMLSNFISKQLNRQLGAAIGYFDIMDIKRCAGKIGVEDFTDSYAIGGVDLAETTDLCNATAMVMKGDKFYVLQAYFIAQGCLERNSKIDQQDYQRYTNMNTDNEITNNIVIITPGSYVQKEYVTAWFCKLRDVYQINFLKIGYDRALSKEWLTNMQENGFDHEIVKMDRETRTEERDYGILSDVAQGGWSLSEPIKIIKELFRSRQIIYDKNNKLFPYCFYNLKVRQDSNNNLSPHKSKSTGHIDGAIGLFNAFVGYQRAKNLEIYKEQIPYLLKI